MGSSFSFSFSMYGPYKPAMFMCIGPKWVHDVIILRVRDDRIHIHYSFRRRPIILEKDRITAEDIYAVIHRDFLSAAFIPGRLSEFLSQSLSHLRVRPLRPTLYISSNYSDENNMASSEPEAREYVLKGLKNLLMVHEIFDSERYET
jgi:hypothetical protein